MGCLGGTGHPTPSPKNLFGVVAHKRAIMWTVCPLIEGNNFRLFSTFQKSIIHLTRTHVRILAGKDGNAVMTKDQYIELINQLMVNCNDIPLLDLIHKLLAKSL